MKAFLSIILAVAVSISTALAKQGGHGGHRGHGGYHGKHGKHFSSVSPRGGRNFSRSGWKFSRGKSGKYRNWGGNWGSGGYWSGGSRFIFIGGFGFPFYSYPYYGYSPYYNYSYGSYLYGYSPYSYNNYDYYSQPAYRYGNQGYGYGDQGYSYGNQGYSYGNQGYGYGDRSSIAQLQRRLARAGYYRGAIDGIMGPETRSAIRDYERSSGALDTR